MRRIAIIPAFLLATMLGRPVVAQVLDDSAGIDITPDAPAAVNIFPAPGSSPIGIAAPSVPDVMTMATSSSGAAIGVPATASPTVGVGNAGNVAASSSAGTAAAVAPGTNVDPYCAVAADPQATAMGIVSSGCDH